MVTLKIRSLAISPSLIVTLLLSPTVALSADSSYPDIPVKAYTAEQSKDVPLNLDDTFIFPTKSSIKFDSALWKEHVGSRVHMLFDLYNQPLNEYSAEKVYDMLGQPNEMTLASPSTSAETATFDLGFLNGSRAMLVVHFDKGIVIWLSLKRLSGNFAPRAEEIWQRKNVNWTTFAHDLNHEFFIVGMRVSLLPAELGRSKQMAINSVRRQRIGAVEFEASADGLTVKQFRVFYLSREGLEVSTPWESTDERKAVTYDPRFLSRKSEINNFRVRRRPYLQFGLPFSSDKWKGFETKYQGFRSSMIPSLVRNYPLIGMSRTEIHQLLGDTAVPKNDVFSERSQLESNKELALPDALTPARIHESYDMSGPGCGLGGSQAFELEFKDDHVVGYRCHCNEGMARNKGSSSGALFGFPDPDASTPAH